MLQHQKLTSDRHFSGSSMLGCNTKFFSEKVNLTEFLQNIVGEKFANFYTVEFTLTLFWQKFRETTAFTNDLLNTVCRLQICNSSSNWKKNMFHKNFVKTLNIPSHSVENRSILRSCFFAQKLEIFRQNDSKMR